MSDNSANHSNNEPSAPDQATKKQGMAVLQWLAVAAAVGIVLTVVLNYLR